MYCALTGETSAKTSTVTDSMIQTHSPDDGLRPFPLILREEGGGGEGERCRNGRENYGREKEGGGGRRGRKRSLRKTMRNANVLNVT